MTSIQNCHYQVVTSDNGRFQFTWLMQSPKSNLRPKFDVTKINQFCEGVSKTWPHRQIKMSKLSITRTHDPNRPMRQVLTLTDYQRGCFLKLTITDIHGMRGCADAFIQSYIHAHLRQLGCVVLRSGFRETVLWVEIMLVLVCGC